MPSHSRSKSKSKSRSSSKKYPYLRMVKKAMMSSAPKEYKKYSSCMKSKCRSERKAVKDARHKLEKGMKRCMLSKKTQSGRKKCFRHLNKSIPSLRKLNKCVKKNCKSEKRKLTKKLKKSRKSLRKSIMKSMKKHRKSHSRSRSRKSKSHSRKSRKSKSHSRSRKSRSHGRVKYYSK